MELQRLQCPNDHDFYIMELDPGIFVDGKKKGNLSRFINHSCDPNCELSVSLPLHAPSLS
jgi:SET domain-containing protein